MGFLVKGGGYPSDLIFERYYLPAPHKIWKKDKINTLFYSSIGHTRFFSVGIHRYLFYIAQVFGNNPPLNL
jgi:hypothetical protein